MSTTDLLALTRVHHLIAAGGRLIPQTSVVGSSINCSRVSYRCEACVYDFTQCARSILRDTVALGVSTTTDYEKLLENYPEVAL